MDEEIREVEAAEGLSALRRAEALSGLDARREALLEQVALAGTETRRTDPEIDRALLLRLRGDYGLRKQPTPDGGYRWEADPRRRASRWRTWPMCSPPAASSSSGWGGSP